MKLLATFLLFMLAFSSCQKELSYPSDNISNKKRIFNYDVNYSVTYPVGAGLTIDVNGVLKTNYSGNALIGGGSIVVLKNGDQVDVNVITNGINPCHLLITGTSGLTGLDTLVNFTFQWDQTFTFWADSTNYLWYDIKYTN